MTKKDPIKMIEDARKEGIPIMVFVAKDKYSIAAIQHYKTICKVLGCDKTHVKGVEEIFNEFNQWQAANPDKVKMPD